MYGVKEYLMGRTIVWVHEPAPILAGEISVVLVLNDGNRIMVGRNGKLFDHNLMSLDMTDLPRRPEPPK